MYILQSLSSREYLRNEKHTKLSLRFLECTFLHRRKLIGIDVNIGLFEEEEKNKVDKAKSVHMLWELGWDVPSRSWSGRTDRDIAQHRKTDTVYQVEVVVGCGGG